MRFFLSILFCALLTNNILSQGITRYGEITNSSNYFLDKNGRTNSKVRLNEFGKMNYYPATVTTLPVKSKTDNSIVCGGDISDDDGSFITEKGVCWSISPNPTISSNIVKNGTGKGIYTSKISGLLPNTSYYIRAYATNNAGTGYGQQIIVRTYTGTVRDIDGNSYNIVTFGKQAWIAENLKTTRYDNGDSIKTTNPPNLTIDPFNDSLKYQWEYYSSGLRDLELKGRLYTSFAAKDNRNVCPANWHLPSISEWETLINTLGGPQDACLKLIQGDFRALPGGFRYDDGNFYNRGSNGYFWTSSWVQPSFIAVNVSFGGQITSDTYIQNLGLSVRCIKNENADSLLPFVKIISVSGLTSEGGKISAEILKEGGSAVTSFGVCWSSGHIPTVADSLLSDNFQVDKFEMLINGLKPLRSYRVRAFAVNSTGTAYSDEIKLTTNSKTPVLPLINTSGVTDLKTTSVITGGDILNNGGAFISSRGVCWSQSPNPTISDNTTTDSTGSGHFSSKVTGITPGTTYYIRAYSVNIAGTAYGNEISFTTPSLESTVSDIDGNIYNTVTIGTQKWMVENLKTTRYNNGDLIGTTNPPSLNLSYYDGGIYQWAYNGDESYVETFGRLYSACAVNNPRNLCPDGWRVSTNLDWETLESFLGMTKEMISGANYWRGTDEADHLKSAILWNLNGNGDNSSGFSALPAGYRNRSGEFAELGSTATWWCAGFPISIWANSRGIKYNQSNIYKYTYESNVDGASVRCVTSLAKINTLPAFSVTYTTAEVTGSLVDEGGTTVIARGICWSKTTNPTLEDNNSPADTSIQEYFFNSITGLEVNTTYYVRTYATNGLGTAYGNEISFTTLPPAIPSLETTAINSVSGSDAVSGGNITSDGAAAVISRGVCWSLSDNPSVDDNKTSDGTGTGTFSSSISGLTPGKVYYVRAYAINNIGTAYGNQLSFTAGAAIITTSPASDITIVTVSSGGVVSSDGGNPVTVRGVCWSASPNPTINSDKTTDGSGTGSFTSQITGLTQGTKYYVRAYATNSIATVYGNEVVFSTIGLPAIETDKVSSFYGTSVIAEGNLSSNGGSSILSIGFCWSTDPEPTITNNKTSTAGFGGNLYANTIPELTPNTTYYIRAYATNIAGTAYGSQKSFNPGFEIGSDNSGGIVFYNDGTGHGLACAPTDYTSGLPWDDNDSFVLTGASGTILGTGKINTDLIINKLGFGFNAAELCADLEQSGYSDWYLPSLDELKLIYNELNLKALGGFDSNAYYWSSSETGIDKAYSLNFGSGYPYSAPKYITFKIRPIRSF